jgi:hypothetical protein
MTAPAWGAATAEAALAALMAIEDVPAIRPLGLAWRAAVREEEGLA